MASNIFRLSLFFLLAAALFCPPVPGFSQETNGIPAVRLSPGNHPAAETQFVPSFEDVPVITPDPAWYAKRGAKKNLSGQADTDTERFAAPDVAVLDRGFSAPWQALLAADQEAAVLVGPDDAAGLSATKKVLIVPSGGLAGTAGSIFFKAALAEYSRQGGVLFCMTQARGSDFSSLPVPAGQRLDAVGWIEDAGPLFRASRFRDPHPVTAGISGPAPAIETEGYFTTIPEGARILLVRPDGHPVIIVYPFGKGWIVASALFTDFSFLLGSANTAEKMMLRNLLAWIQDPAKSGPAPQQSPVVLPPKPFSISGNRNKQFRVHAGIDRKSEMIHLTLETGADSTIRGQTVLIRTAGQEKSVTLPGDSIRLSFDLPAEGIQTRVPYAIYASDGRALSRGSFVIPPKTDRNVFPDGSSYFPGDKASIGVASMGKGEILVSGLGFADNKIISGQGSIVVPVPDDLPAGTYPLQWSFDEIHGNRAEGSFTVDLSGYRTFIDEISLERGDKSRDSTAIVKIRSTGRPAGRLRIELTSPTGKTRTVAEPVVSLKEGTQTIPVSFPFTPDAGGIWELNCTLLSLLPEGAGIPPDPVIMDRAGMLFDAGDTAVLSLVPDRTFFYEPSGPVRFSAALFGSGKTTVEVFLDDKRITREKIKLNGTVRYPLLLPPMEAGLHRVRLSLAGKDIKSIREESLIYGLGLPDLSTGIRTGDPAAGAQGPFLPVTLMVTNQGKSQAGPSHVGLWEGDPERGGKLITKLEVPSLPPNAQHSMTVEWPLYAKAGPRRIVSAADSDRSVSEADKSNNNAVLEVTIPDLLLVKKSASSAFRAGQPVSLPLSLFNLTGRSFSGAEVAANIDDLNGGRLSSQTIRVDPVPAGIENRIDAVFKLDSALMGDYRFAATLSGAGKASAVAGTVTILPTLLLTGSLEGTPAAVPLCTPFSIHYNIQNAGNLRPSAGTVRIELVAAGTPEPVFSKEAPLAYGPQTLKIDNIDLPRGHYTVRMTASATQQERRLTGQFTLGEQTLELTGPIHAARLNSLFPRVLVWFGREGRIVEQAAAEKILKHAFEQEDLYYRIVDSEEDFSRLAMTELFNVYVLFEPQEMLARTDWLKSKIERGHGLVIIGSGEIARALAEDFGFRFEELPSKKQSSLISFTGKTALALSGTVPVTGKQFIPRKRGAVTAAVYTGSDDAAALIDHGTAGTIVSLPLPLSRSAFSGGPSEFYSLLVRTSAVFAVPQREVPGGPASGALTLSSPAGQFKVRLREILPPGSSVLWTNAGGNVKDNIITYAVTADKEQIKLLYLYQPSASGTERHDSEISYECRGRFMNQGKVE